MLLEQLDLTGLIALAAVMAFSGLVHGTLGLGFPLVSTLPIALMVDVRTAILWTLLPTVAVNMASIVGGKGYGDSLKRFWPLAVSAFCNAGRVVAGVGRPAPVQIDPRSFDPPVLVGDVHPAGPYCGLFSVTAMLVFGVWFCRRDDERNGGCSHHLLSGDRPTASDYGADHEYLLRRWEDRQIIVLSVAGLRAGRWLSIHCHWQSSRSVR